MSDYNRKLLEWANAETNDAKVWQSRLNRKIKGASIKSLQYNYELATKRAGLWPSFTEHGRRNNVIMESCIKEIAARETGGIIRRSASVEEPKEYWKNFSRSQLDLHALLTLDEETRKQAAAYYDQKYRNTERVISETKKDIRKREYEAFQESNK